MGTIISHASRDFFFLEASLTDLPHTIAGAQSTNPTPL